MAVLSILLRLIGQLTVGTSVLLMAHGKVNCTLFLIVWVIGWLIIHATYSVKL